MRTNTLPTKHPQKKIFCIIFSIILLSIIFLIQNTVKATVDTIITITGTNINIANMYSYDVSMEFSGALEIGDIATIELIDSAAISISKIYTGIGGETGITLNFDTNTLTGGTFTMCGNVADSGMTIIAGPITEIAILDIEMPTFSGVESGMIYTGIVIITFDDNNSGVIATLNSISYTSGDEITGGGLYEFIVTDIVGNSTGANFEINISDTTAPSFNITSGQYFSGDVHVEVTDENYSGTIVTYSGSDTLYTTTGFTLTGEGYYFLTAYDTEGNSGSIGFTIDLTPPTFTGVISGTTYYTGVYIEFFDNNEGVTATLNGSGYTSGDLITATGEYIFIVTDLAGNSTGATFTITDPDTTPPTATIDYYPASGSRTNTDVLAVITGFSEEITGLNAIQYLFTGNGTFLFTFEDLAGNTGETLATVDRIDKENPVVTINGSATIYVEFGNSYTELGATRSDNIDGTGDVSIISGTVNTGTLGTYPVEYIYVDQAGNTGTDTRTVIIQDTIPPTATIEYSPAGPSRTSGDVIAILTGFSESVTITNNGGSGIYLFTTNGSFTFEFEDVGGNTGETLTTVDRIDKDAPTINNTGTISTTTGTATINGIDITEAGAGLTSAFFEYSGVANSTITGNLQLATGNLNNLTGFIGGLDHNATYFYSITLTDNVGNISFITGTFQTIIDRNIIYTEVRSGNVLSGINTNLSSVTNDNVTNFSGLELEIPSIGRINILTGIDLTDPGTQEFLQSLGETMIMENGYINFIVYDTSTLSGSAFKDIPATLTMRLTTAQFPNGAGSVDNIVVRENNGTIIESSSILSNFLCTGSALPGIEQECSFDTSHFTSFGTKPTLTTVSIYSSNSNSGYAKLGDTITLSFTGSEPLTGVSALITSNGANILGTGTDRTGSYTLVGGESEGSVSLSIDFEDFYSNTGITVTATTDSSQVIIDLTNPTVTNITSGEFFSGDITPTIVEINYSGATLNGSDYTSGTAISAEGNYELIVTDLAGNTFAISFTIDTTTPTFGGITSGAYYTGTVTLTFSDSGTLNGTPIANGYSTGDDGNYELIVTDLAGNATGATFTIDNTLPQVSNIISGQRFSGNITPTIVETNYSGATLNGSEYTGTEISADGNYELIVIDLAGNSFAVSFSIDQTPPTASIEYIPVSGSRTNGNVIATLTGFNEPITITNNGGTGVYAFSTNGTFTFTFEDHVGNTGETTATVTWIDTTPPTVTTGVISAGNTGNNGATLYYNGTITIRADVSDTGGSELNTTSCEYTIDGTIWNAASYDTGYCYATGLAPATDITIQFRITDIAGNINTGAARNYLYDNTAPTTTDNANSITGNVDVTVTLTPVDTGINVITTYYCVDTAGTCTPTTTGTSVSVTGAAGVVTHKFVRYYSVDSLGNTETIKTSVQINIDKENPYLTGTTTFSSNNTTNSGYAKIGDTITVLFQSHEALTGTPTMTISGGSLSTGTVTHIGGNNYSGTYIMKSSDTEGAIGFNITMTDLVGNTGTIFTGSTIIFDRTAPAGITITAPTTGTYLKGDPDVYTITWTIGTETNYGATPLLLEYSVTNFVSTTNITTETANNGTYTFTFPNTLNTFAKIRIKATDLAGNVSYFTGNQFSIDNTPPTDITITYPGLYLKGNSGYIINRSGGIDANPETIILAYTTNGTTFTTICTRTNNEQSCTRNTPNINSSTVQLRTIATDKVGMNKQRTTPTFIVDSISPTAIVFADNNSNRRNTNATATGTSTDALAGLRTTGMVYRIDTAFTGTCDGGTTTPPTFTTEGYHTGYACIMDRAGNIRTGQQNYKIDKTVPTLEIGSGILTNTATIINITGADALAGISGYLRSQISGPGIATFTTATSEDPSVSANTDGTYVLQVVVRDNANNITTGTTNFTRDTTAPILSGAASVLNTTSQTPNYSFTGNEGGTISYSGGCTSATTTAISGNNTITFSTLANGTYASCQLRVTDAAGNNSSRLTIPTFTVNYSAPSGGGGGGGGGGMPICSSSQLQCINNIYAIKPGQSCFGGDLGKPCGTDICVDGDYSGDPNDGICYDPTKVEAQTGTSSTGKRIPFTSPYNKELTDAYSYAYGVKITTVPKIERANLTGILIRSHLAKMMSEYAIKVLGKTPDTSRQCTFKDMGKQTEEFQRYAKMACQLGLMGLKTDGSPADIFNPEDQVNRAIFGTTLSRALFGGTHNGGQNRYERHLQALKSSAVMNIINTPFNRELRGYVMLMMMRADQKITKSSYSNFNSLRGSSVFVPTTPSTNTQTGTQFTATELDFIKNINKAYQFTEGYTIGQSNPGVKYLQYFLKAKKYYDGTINGVNNTATVAALFQFQFDNDIVSKQSDQGAGYLGPTTRETINPVLKKLLNP